jgi:hypothetical protein
MEDHVSGHLGRIAKLIGLSLSLLSCVVSVQPSGLPDYGRARTLSSSPDEIEELVRYRPLSRADFKAESPRPEMADHAKDMGAYTCVMLPPRIDREVDVTYDVAAGVYVARVVYAGFFAVMDPNCSWWNPSQSSVPPDYVLQHEQIHFMLAEIEARKVLAKARNMEGRASSRVESSLRLQEQLDLAARNATTAFLKVTNRFDDETSATYEPRAQAGWLAYAEAELKRLPASLDRAAERDGDTQSGSSLEPL